MLERDINYYFKVGLSFSREDKYDLAIENYKKAIEINADCCEIYYNLGNIYFKLEQYDLAIENYKKAIPNYPSALNGIGLAYYKIGCYDLAIKSYNKALELIPDSVDIYINLAFIYNTLNQIDNIIHCYKKIIELDPLNVMAYLNLGVFLQQKGNADEAIKYYQKALDFEPQNTEIINNLGLAFMSMGEFNKALNLYQKASESGAVSPEIYNNLGELFLSLNSINNAIDSYKKAISLKPDYIKALLRLTDITIKNDSINEAEEYLNKVTEIDINTPEECYSFGVKFLQIRNFKKGLELYESRFFVRNSSYPEIITDKPKWNGSDLRNKSVLVLYEQGLGDCIQFIRYIPKLVSLGAKVYFISPNELEKLFKQSDLGCEVLNCSNGVKFDTYVYLLSLPYLFKTSSTEEIPLKTKYLKADINQVEFYKEKYFNNNFFKIGIFWHGNPKYPKNQSRSIPLKYFYPILNLPNVKVYSLQKEHGLDQINEMPAEYKLIRIGETFNNLAETAAAIENFDLLIGIDTAIAHLAGALGKPVWLILDTDNDWRWSRNIEHSYWYNSIKLFRQKDIGDWHKIMERVRISLNMLM